MCMWSSNQKAKDFPSIKIGWELNAHEWLEDGLLTGCPVGSLLDDGSAFMLQSAEDIYSRSTTLDS